MTNKIGAEKEYRDRLAEGKFGLQICLSCEKYAFFPRVVCPSCGGISLKWKEATGRGGVYSTTVVRRRQEEGGDFNVSIIELEEGPRMLSRVEGVAPAAVKIGMLVIARILDSKGGPLVIFVPEGKSNERVS